QGRRRRLLPRDSNRLQWLASRGRRRVRVPARRGSSDSFPALVWGSKRDIRDKSDAPGDGNTSPPRDILRAFCGPVAASSWTAAPHRPRLSAHRGATAPLRSAGRRGIGRRKGAWDAHYYPARKNAGHKRRWPAQPLLGVLDVVGFNDFGRSGGRPFNKADDIGEVLGIVFDGSGWMFPFGVAAHRGDLLGGQFAKRGRILAQIPHLHVVALLLLEHAGERGAIGELDLLNVGRHGHAHGHYQAVWTDGGTQRFEIGSDSRTGSSQFMAGAAGDSFVVFHKQIMAALCLCGHGTFVLSHRGVKT